MGYAHGLCDSVAIPKAVIIFCLLFFLSFLSEYFHWLQRRMMHLQFVPFLADREKGNKKEFCCLVSTHICFAIYSIVSLCYSLKLFWAGSGQRRKIWLRILYKAIHRKKKESNICLKREENHTVEISQSCGYIHMWL